MAARRQEAAQLKTTRLRRRRHPRTCTATRSRPQADADYRSATGSAQMLLIRRFEEKAGEAYSLGKIGGFCHLYIGQEAVAVGMHRRAAARRLHHRVLPRARPGAGARHDARAAVMAELFGKATGCSHGKGGSMHLFDASLGFLGGHGIVGGHIPLATGIGVRHQVPARRTRSRCASSARPRSTTARSTRRSTWRRSGSCPAIFICENNRYGMGTALERASATCEHLRAGDLLRHGPRGGGRPGRAGGDAAMDAGGGAGPARTSAHPARDPHLPLRGSLDVRPDPRALPHQGRGRGAPQAGPDRAVAREAEGGRAASTSAGIKTLDEEVMAEVRGRLRVRRAAPDPEPRSCGPTCTRRSGGQLSAARS